MLENTFELGIKFYRFRHCEVVDFMGQYNGTARIESAFSGSLYNIVVVAVHCGGGDCVPVDITIGRIILPEYRS